MDVPTMFRKGSYKYADLPKYDAKCIELPYAVIFFSSKNKFFFEISFCELICEQQSSKKLTKSEIDHFSVCFVWFDPRKFYKFIFILQNKDISMVIILPNKITGLLSLTDQLEEVTAECNNQLSQTFPREVHLFLPKFKTETKLDLEDALSKKVVAYNVVLQIIRKLVTSAKCHVYLLFQMGLTTPFSNNANFTGITEVPLKISKVVQKAFIEVNEEGSEAAAVTGEYNLLCILHFFICKTEDVRNII